jgi:uncharacterized SAM-dependent methyltransferase
VLGRINRELGGRFDLSNFDHVSFWNARKSRIEMHLQSTVDQAVWVQDLARCFYFSRGERLHTENSYKFSAATIASLLRRAGLRLEKTWMDPQEWFSVALARV